MKILIQNGRLLDPASGLDKVGDLAIASGRIVGLGSEIVVGRTAKEPSDLFLGKPDRQRLGRRGETNAHDLRSFAGLQRG